MKSHLIGFAIAFFCLAAKAQVTFEPGYFIDNSGNEVRCLIRNIDWKNNPQNFRYKLNEEGETLVGDIAGVSEFGIADQLVYQRYTVNVDRRGYLPSELSLDRNPRFSEEQLFLKVLVRGQATLFGFEDGNLRRYFLSTDGKAPEQLVFTKYKTADNKVLGNFTYKSQLASELKCDAITSTTIDETEYTEQDLTDLFIEYNKCTGAEYTHLADNGKRKLLHINLRPGLDYSSMKVGNRYGNVTRTEFDNQVSLRFGAELELLLPFNGNKWAVTFEPFYKSFKAENDNDTNADYKALVISIGVRHYFFLNGKSKLFLNGNFGMEVPMNSSIRAATLFSRQDLDIEGSILDNYWAVGFGYNFNDKASLELRYNIEQDLLVGYDAWYTKYGGFSLIFGYTIL
jgi:hypothetical protein